MSRTWRDVRLNGGGSLDGRVVRLARLEGIVSVPAEMQDESGMVSSVVADFEPIMLRYGYPLVEDGVYQYRFIRCRPQDDPSN